MTSAQRLAKEMAGENGGNVGGNQWLSGIMQRSQSHRWRYQWHQPCGSVALASAMKAAGVDQRRNQRIVFSNAAIIAGGSINRLNGIWRKYGWLA